MARSLARLLAVQIQRTAEQRVESGARPSEIGTEHGGTLGPLNSKDLLRAPHQHLRERDNQTAFGRIARLLVRLISCTRSRSLSISHTHCGLQKPRWSHVGDTTLRVRPPTLPPRNAPHQPVASPRHRRKRVPPVQLLELIVDGGHNRGGISKRRLWSNPIKLSTYVAKVIYLGLFHFRFQLLEPFSNFLDFCIPRNSRAGDGSEVGEWASRRCAPGAPRAAPRNQHPGKFEALGT